MLSPNARSLDGIPGQGHELHMTDCSLRPFLSLIVTACLLPAALLARPPYDEDHKAELAATEKVMKEQATFTHFRVEFNGIKGDRVPAHLYLPKSTNAIHPGRLPAVLVQHGIGDKKTSAYITATCRLLAEKGVIAFAIDAPNRGERRQPGKDTTSIFDPASVHDWFRQHCGDYSRAFDYLVSRPDVAPAQLGYIGFSWGAITGITFVAHDARVKAMASIGGGGQFGDYLGKPAKGGEGKDAEPPLDPVYNISLIAPRPLLLVSARKDLIVLPVFASALHKAAGAGSKVEWYDTDHFFSGLDREKILGTTVDFVKQALAGPKQKE